MVLCLEASCGFHCFTNLVRICRFNLVNYSFPMVNGAFKQTVLSLYWKYNTLSFMPSVFGEELAELQMRSPKSFSSSYFYL